MTELAEFSKSLKKGFTPKIKEPSKPVSCWSEKDIIDNKIVDAFVTIFRTKGCSWALKSGCTMCGYFNDSLWKNISKEDFLKQLETVLKKYNNEPFIKIFTSGSFLDDNEIKPNVRKKILQRFAEKTDKISVESRPEYVTNKTLKETKKILGSTVFEVGIGLETASDFIRTHSINKGFTLRDYRKAADVLKKHNYKLKTYILIKPPFLTEKEAITDCIKTVDEIKTHVDTISFNPTNVQKNSVVEYLWKRRQYRPPWLWSVVDILKNSKKNTKNVYIKCDVAGGGSIRGSHNCKKCDHIVLNAITKFSLSQDIQVFKDLNCECREKWLDQLDIENIGFGSLVDMSR